MIRTYLLVLTIEHDDPSTDPDDLDAIVASVVEHSTAREAIETGVDASLATRPDWSGVTVGVRLHVPATVCYK